MIFELVDAPFWPQLPTRYAGRLPRETEVLIVGGGITGVALRHHLAERAIHADLVERDHLASGASGRNAGFLLAGVAENYAAAVRTYGRSRAREVWALTVENHERQIEATGGADVGYRRRGSLILASGPAEASELEQSAQLLSEDGFRASWDGRALFNPGDGEVTPTAVVGAIAARGPASTVHEGVEVDAVESGGIVHAGGSTCKAGIVILATNGYTARLVASVPIEPARAQMLATAPIAARVSELPTYSHHGYRYWRQMPGGEVLLGGWRDTSFETEKTAEAEPAEPLQSRLEAAVRDLAAEAHVTHRWAGTMGLTEDGLPIVGPVEGLTNTYVCAGFNGHGMGLAFMSAKRLVETLA